MLGHVIHHVIQRVIHHVIQHFIHHVIHCNRSVTRDGECGDDAFTALTMPLHCTHRYTLNTDLKASVSIDVYLCDTHMGI